MEKLRVGESGLWVEESHEPLVPLARKSKLVQRILGHRLEPTPGPRGVSSSGSSFPLHHVGLL